MHIYSCVQKCRRKQKNDSGNGTLRELCKPHRPQQIAYGGSSQEFLDVKPRLFGRQTGISHKIPPSVIAQDLKCGQTPFTASAAHFLLANRSKTSHLSTRVSRFANVAL